MDDIQSLIEELRFGAENGADAELLERAADKIQELVADLGDADAMTEYWMKKNEWVSVKERLPEDEKKVLIILRNIYGHTIVLMAAHIGHHKKTTDDYGWTEYDEAEYDEENDCYWIPEQWYEMNYVEDNINWEIDSCEGEVTHWMPLPDAPEVENKEESK